MQPSNNASNMQFPHNVGFGPGTGLQGVGGDNGYIANPVQYNNPNTQQWGPSPAAFTPNRPTDPTPHVQTRKPEKSTPQKARHEGDDEDDDDSDSE